MNSRKAKLIGGAWAAGGGLGLAAAYRRLRSFETEAPCLAKAIQAVAASEAGSAVLGGGELKLAWWPRQVAVDRETGCARASFQVRGSGGAAQVVLAASRPRKAVLEEHLEEDEVQLSGWRYYWSKPWELKKRVVERFASTSKEEEEEFLRSWSLSGLLLFPVDEPHKATVLMGDPMALPEYEAMCLRRDADAKGEKSRRRLKIVGGVATSLFLVAAAVRLRRSIRVSRSYGFVKGALVAHRDVAAVLGKPVSVQTSSGTFGAGYISGRLTLVGAAGKVGEVEVAATRDGNEAQPWRVVLARMRHAGASVNLDKAQF